MKGELRRVDWWQEFGEIVVCLWQCVISFFGNNGASKTEKLGRAVLQCGEATWLMHVVMGGQQIGLSKVGHGLPWRMREEEKEEEEEEEEEERGSGGTTTWHAHKEGEKRI